MFRLDENRVVVTGAASGIGDAVARLFAQQGASVVVVDLDAAKSRSVAEEIACAASSCDISDASGVEHTFKEIAANGPVHGLVTCAGVAHVGKLETTSVQDLDRLYGINVRGTYLFCVLHDEGRRTRYDVFCSQRLYRRWNSLQLHLACPCVYALRRRISG